MSPRTLVDPHGHAMTGVSSLATERRMQLPALVLETLGTTTYHAPMFAYYLYARSRVLAVRPDDPIASRIRTGATNGANIFLNLDFLESLSPAERMFLVLHEVAHDFLGHIPLGLRFRQMQYVPTLDNSRQLPYDADLLNEAEDAVINRWLVTSHLGKMPDKGIWYDWVTDDHHALEVYERLIDEKGEGEGEGEGENPGGGNPCEDGEPGQSGGEPSTDEAILDASEQGNRLGNAHLDAHLYPEALPTQAEEAGRQQDIDMAIGQGKLAGKLPANIRKKVDAQRETKIDWRDVLADMMIRTIGQGVRDSRRINRRSWLRFRIVDSAQSTERCGTLAFIVDVSASTHALIPDFLGALHNVAADLAPEKMFVIWTDTRVMGVNTFEDAEATDIAKMETRHGGGTDLRSAFTYIDGGGDDDDDFTDLAAIVVLTDSETPWPTLAPDCPVIVATSGPKLEHPDWMHVVAIDPK